MVSGQLRIRPAALGDFPRWSALWESYNAFYGRVGPTALPLETTQATWSRFFDAAQPSHALVAERDGELVGLAHYLFHLSTLQIPPICYLQDLFTAEPHRGQGIGRALIQAVYEQARTAGTGKVYWQTHETNAASRKLMDKIADRSEYILYRKLL
jgi:GNAT superfamily N-acetyltransferase